VAVQIVDVDGYVASGGRRDADRSVGRVYVDRGARGGGGGIGWHSRLANHLAATSPWPLLRLPRQLR